MSGHSIELCSVGSASPITPPPPPPSCPEEKKDAAIKKKRNLESLASSSPAALPTAVHVNHPWTQPTNHQFEMMLRYQSQWLDERFDKSSEYSRQCIAFHYGEKEKKDCPSQPTVTASKPVTVESKHAPTVLKIERQHHYQLPEWLTTNVWKRHRLTLGDIEILLHACHDNRWLWILNMLYGISTHHSLKKMIQLHSNNTRKVLLQAILEYFHDWNPTMTSFKIGEPAFKKLQSQLVAPASKRIKKETTPGKKEKEASLVVVASQIFGQQPIHYVSQKVFEPLTENMEQQPWEWEHIYVVALEHKQTKYFQYLLMGRILPWSKYVEIYGSPTCLLDLPRILSMGHKQEKFAVTEEKFYFVTDPQNASADDSGSWI